ncbi:hypothetical protein N7452_000933 [Penicillium brevicompactum]|uniref:Centromere protein X n=1 Tax=Penicillium brevicompactum TaxID=5074 RepID=A0A9W9R3K8_PENBR|nr:hypothetical protein N7452_000933 [Penicillium brevicompactum]
MAGEPKPAPKRSRLPFKPPSRTTSAGPSSTSKPKAKTKQPAAKAATSQPAHASTETTKPPTPTTAHKPAKATKATKPRDSTNPKQTAKRRRVESPAPDDAQSGSESGSDGSGRSRSRSISQEPDYILAEITTTNPVEDVNSSDPKIPPKLLTRLLHEHFQNDKTKIAKDANNVVAKYIDVFVREAIARAAFERAETNGNAGGRSVGDGFLEVEDLEKMAPQLTMDF